MLQGDGTQQNLGGPIEGRSENPSTKDPQILAQLEIQRQQEAVGTMIDDLQATLFDPLSANFPGLAVAEKPFTLPDLDEEGNSWTFTPHLPSGDQRISSVFVEGQITKPFQGKEEGRTVVVNIRANMDRRSTNPFNNFGFRSPEEGITFMQKKLQSLLAPIKAAQASVANALPRWSMGPEGERVLTIPPINPPNGGLGYLDEHP